MKTKLILTVAITAAVVLLYQSRFSDAQAQNVTPARFEYAAVRFMGGDRVMVAFPDGSAKWLSEISPYQRPKWADERVFNLTQAVNFLSKQGYEPAVIPSLETHSDDVWMRRVAR